MINEYEELLKDFIKQPVPSYALENGSEFNNGYRAGMEFCLAWFLELKKASEK